MDRYEDFKEAVSSLSSQSHADLEVVAVIDGNKELYNRLKEDGIKIDKIALNERNLGLSQSRNRGVEEASGNIIAFFDDDAVADTNWIKELVRMYEERDAIAAGGKLLPKWIPRKANSLPEEYYWMIGATHKGFPEEITEVRNTFGSNLSFKADVIRALNAFRNESGMKGEGLLQGAETELCQRMRERFGKGVVYNPGAIVYHKVFPERLRMKYLLRRAFWQGYSKRVMKERGYPLEEEEKFVRLLFAGIAGRIKAKSLVAFKQLVILVILTSSAILGYAVKLLKSKET
jgi:GT2 family glycosyltransferase